MLAYFALCKSHGTQLGSQELAWRAVVEMGPQAQGSFGRMGHGPKGGEQIEELE